MTLTLLPVDRIVLFSLSTKVRYSIDRWLEYVLKHYEFELRDETVRNVRLSIERLFENGILLEVTDEMVAQRRLLFDDPEITSPRFTPYKSIHVAEGAVDISEKGVPFLDQVITDTRHWPVGEFCFFRRDLSDSSGTGMGRHYRFWTTSIQYCIAEDESGRLSSDRVFTNAGLLKDHWWRSPKQGFYTEWRSGEGPFPTRR